MSADFIAFFTAIVSTEYTAYCAAVRLSICSAKQFAVLAAVCSTVGATNVPANRCTKLDSHGTAFGAAKCPAVRRANVTANSAAIDTTVFRAYGETFLVSVGTANHFTVDTADSKTVVPTSFGTVFQTF